MVILKTGRRASAPLVPVLALLGAAPPVQAKPAWTSGTFIYADLCTLPESGTRVGQRIILRRSPNGDALTYEGAERAGPVAAAAMSLDDATRTITFAVETGTGSLQFQGIAAADALTGTLNDEAGPHPVHLPRVLRSHVHEACPVEITGSIAQHR